MSAPAPVLFRVERGSPTPEELAVVAAVLLSRPPAGTGPLTGPRRAAWATTSREPAGSWSTPTLPSWHRTA
ncbi:acyl-CoA carboxylase subunit epsilon [Peterkaempfera sp. SMS 1(5)a]|uniref:acyl-CoA carboxylase subunit epsilon n=1 Tax=Peterkaempfera podocarpi TaxID=3232308 RepID=UPI00366C39D4